jgi:outer membrane lipoprotein-sorting protein
MKHILAVISFALLFGAFAVPRSNAQILTKVLKTMEAHKNALQSLRANIKYSEFEGDLQDETEKSGEVHFLQVPKKDPYVRIDWTQPTKEMLLVANGKYLLYRQEINQVIRGLVDDSKKQKGTSNTLKFMSMSKKELESNYFIEYLDSPSVGGTETWHLKLTPKGKDSFVEAQLWVDGNGMPIQAMIRQKNKDETTVRLSSIKKNITMSASTFKPVLPSNVKEVKG